MDVEIELHVYTVVFREIRFRMSMKQIAQSNISNIWMFYQLKSVGETK